MVAPVVYYIARRDVKMERLVRSDHKTHCPFKGDASYYSVKDGPENAVWSYERPYDEMTAIGELLAEIFCGHLVNFEQRLAQPGITPRVVSTAVGRLGQ